MVSPSTSLSTTSIEQHRELRQDYVVAGIEG
jgi:hypothetical protein